MTELAERANAILAELFFTPGHPDPHPLYRELREISAVHETPMGFVAVAFAAGEAVLRDSRLVSGPASTPAMASDVRNVSAARWLFYQNPPDHTRLRGLVAKAFTPRSIEALRPYVASLV